MSNVLNLEKLTESVNKVVAEEAESSLARNDLAEVSADLLGQVVGFAKPALSAIGDRPIISHNVSHHADVNYCGGATDETRYAHRCVPLSCAAFGPEEDCPRANEGRFEGRDLAARADGVLVCLEYSGSWSRWQGSSWGWQAEVTEYAGPSEAIADGWTDVEGYITHLADKLSRAVGKRKDRIEADRRRVEKLGAVVALLSR